MKAAHLAWSLVALGCIGDKMTTSDDSTTTSLTTSTADATTGTSTSATSQPTTTGESSSSSSSATSSTGEPPPLLIPDPEFCPLDWSGPTMVAGETPFGVFIGGSAWFEWQLCNGYYPLLIVVEDPSVLAAALEGKPIPRGVAVSLPLVGWEQMALTGQFEPRFYAIVDGEFVDDNGVDGAATVTASVSVADTEAPEGIPHIVGTFSIHSENTPWDLSGTFDAAYCGPFNNAIHINC